MQLSTTLRGRSRHVFGMIDIVFFLWPSRIQEAKPMRVAKSRMSKPPPAVTSKTVGAQGPNSTSPLRDAVKQASAPVTAKKTIVLQIAFSLGGKTTSALSCCRALLTTSQGRNAPTKNKNARSKMEATWVHTTPHTDAVKSGASLNEGCQEGS